MQRFYFLIPALDTAKKLVIELQNMGIDEKNIYVLGKQDTITEAHFHPAGVMQISDVQPALKKGALMGGILGFLAGVVAIIFPLAGFELGGGLIIGMTVFGIVFGAWASSMIGISVKTPIVAKFEQAVKEGQFLMLVDFKHQREGELLELIKSHHPEIIINRVNLLNSPTEVWDQHHQHIVH